MNTPKLPPLPPACGIETLTAIGWGYTEDDMQAYAIAAIEAQGVPIAPQASVVHQEPFGCVTVVRKLGHADTYHFYPHPQSPYLDNASECHTLYTHPAQQDKPQPLLSSEIWDNDAIMEVNADAQLPYELIERFVRAIEAAHGIKGGAA